VPYTIIGGQKFYEKKEVKDLISYMTVLLNPKDQMAIRRILNVPNRGIGRVTLEKYLKVGEERGMTLFEAMTEHPEIAGKSEKNIRAFSELIKKQQEHFDNHPLNEAISMLIDDIEFFKFIEKQYDSAKQVERRKNDVMVFIESAERFVQFQKNHATLKNFVEKLLLQDNQDKQEDDEDDDVRKNEVTLMTLHSSKGLEFDTVYLVGMEEESLPHKNVIKLGEDISEERRLCYVGITRAQQKLIMTYCKERKIYGKNLVRHKSRFLEEIDKEELFVHQDRTNFGHLASEEEIEQYKKDKFAAMMNLLDD
jgi:ATP-dependent DNA helicase Rep/DNA helicase-2/ATP-dependent DNA helicase PcrA